MSDNIIGQINLKALLKAQIKSETLPRFMIIVAPKGSGKQLISEWIPMQIPELTYSYVLSDVKVDTIRNMIEQSYTNKNKTFYIIPNADKMSVAAKNALLKVTEEPPNNSYFIMTLEDIEQTLDTIRSRGTVYYMDPYTPDNISDYYYSKYQHDHSIEEIGIVKNLCQTPGEVDTLVNECGVIAFYDYVKLVVDNIAKVSGSNAFKIGDKLKFKDTDSGKYDLTLFWKAFMSICVERIDDTKYIYGIAPTSRALQELRIKGINKQALFDKWLLQIRERWMDYYGIDNCETAD